MSGDERRYYLEYSTVYVLNGDQKKKLDRKYDVYVGEANSITRRTRQRLQAKGNVGSISAETLYKTFCGIPFYIRSIRKKGCL